MGEKIIYTDLFELHSMFITKDGLRVIDANQTIPHLKDADDPKYDPERYKAISNGYIHFWNEVSKKL